MNTNNNASNASSASASGSAANAQERIYKPGDFKWLDKTVFPSEEKTVACEFDDEYGGAHKYKMNLCRGFENGQTHYLREAYKVIQFIQKHPDGKITDGLQSEQLVIALIDRTNKLNAKYPSAQNEKMIAGLQMFLDACKERVEERIARGVMGELKK